MLAKQDVVWETQSAHARLHEYASYITDDALRCAFLENVATHRELRRAFAEATLAETPFEARI